MQAALSNWLVLGKREYFPAIWAEQDTVDSDRRKEFSNICTCSLPVVIQLLKVCLQRQVKMCAWACGWLERVQLSLEASELVHDTG